MTDITTNKNIKHITNQQDKLDNFADILSNISSLDNKKQALWLEIYENATNERAYVEFLYQDALRNGLGNPEFHMLMGTILAKYLERMGKANDQLIKLAELIQREVEEDQAISMDDAYNAIGD